MGSQLTYNRFGQNRRQSEGIGTSIEKSSLELIPISELLNTMGSKSMAQSNPGRLDSAR